MHYFLTICRSWQLSDFFRCKTVTFPSFFTDLQRKKSYRGLKRNLLSLEEEELPTPLPLLPAHITSSHPESLLAYSTPTMAAKCLNLPPVPSTVTSFPLSNAPLPTPAGWWCRPSSSPLSLARDDDDGSDVHCCSCCRVVVVLVVMLVVVLLLSIIPSRRCCHRSRCHH